MSKNILDKKYKSIRDTIKKYPDQLLQAWDEIQDIKLPKEFSHIENVVVCAMGGSALGARIVDSLIVGRVQVPIEIFTQYHVPNYVGNKTLVILSSYSGNTEEVISCFHEAHMKKAQIFGITTGGELEGELVSHKLPRYVFDPKMNPSKQPRMAIGYASGALLSLFYKLRIVHLWREEIESAVEVMREETKINEEEVDESTNMAKRYAKKLKGRAPILVASEHLLGVAHTIKNQLNESAKTFSVLFDLPELNHHLMEGLKNPAKIREVFHFIFINSDLYSDRVNLRYPLTTQVVEKQGLEFSLYKPRSDKKVDQVYEFLIFGSYVAYYLSKIYGVDPKAIPWVDYFKAQLSKG
ncbi:hypothetical protein IID22_01245 [Patescibacteria group bacterium]|nr:hypothetical protein [Patescibacteria group bacterium]